MKLQRAFFVVVALVFVASFASVVSGATKVRNTAQVGSATSPTVERLFLINADTDQQIAELTSGYVINTTTLGTTRFNIEAKTSPAVVGSVGFKLDALAVRTENTPPYAYAGDNGAGNYNSFTMTPGSHTLVVNAYTLSNRTGTQGPTKTVNFTVTDVAGTTPTTTGTTTGQMAVTSFVLVNSDTNQDLMTITDGQTVMLDQLGTDKLTLRADTTALPSLPKSVKFKVNGQNHSTENLWPFTIPAGVADDDYRPWNFNLGETYTIEATPFENSGGNGTSGSPLTINFTIVANANTTGGSHASVVTPPAIPCLSATLTYGVGNGSQGPAQINAWWDPVPGVTNYRVWRQVNSYDDILVQDSTTGTAYYTTNLSPSTIHIRVAALVFDEAAHAWVEGPKSLISVVVASSGSTSTYTTCLPTSGQTTSLSLSTPTENANVLSSSNFNITAVGAPTNDQISSVKFFYKNEVGNTVLLGIDSSGPDFTLAANLAGDRGAVCPSIYAEATLINGSRIKTPRRYIIITDTAATSPMASCPNNGEAAVELYLTSPSQSGTYNAGQQFAVTAEITGAAPQKVVFYHQGGNVAQNLANGLPPYTTTLIGTRTSPPYTLNYSVATPGNNGLTQSTDAIRVIAYYSDGRATFSGVPFKVIPSAVQPQITSLSLMKTDATVVSTVASGMSINVGTQANANTPLGSGFSMRANAAGTPNPAPASVSFSVTGPSGFTPITRCETSAPFSLFGDSTTYTPWPTPYVLGGYTVTATPYTTTGCSGAPSTGYSMTFQLVNLDDTTPPSNPGTITTTYRSASEIRISWGASTDAQTGVSSYTVTRVGGPSASVPGTQTTFTDNAAGLTAGGAVTYSVTAVNGVGQSSGSTQAPAQSLSTAFTSGANVQTKASTFAKSTPDGANLNPQHAFPPAHVGTISGTPIYYNNANYWNVSFATVPPNGWVIETALEFQPTADTQAPNQVTGLTVTNPTSSTLYVDWAPTTDNGGGSVVSYQIWRSTTQNGTYTQVAGSPVAASQTDFTDTGLASGQTYWYKVLAADNATPTANVTNIASATAASNTTTTVVAGTCNPGTSAPVLPGSGGDLSRTNGMNKSVQMSSAVTGANQITICWDTVPQRTISGSISVYRKSGYTSTSWGTAIATLANTATSYVDNGVTSGTYYEYKVSFNQTSDTSLYNTYTYNGTTFSDNTSGTAAGYIATGISVPEESSRGKMALVIDNSMATGTNGSAPTGGSLASKVITLIDDLNADRWTVYPIYVGRGDTVASVKASIVAQNPTAIYLLGHVPVDKTHTMYPDGHGDQIPWSSDAYYSVSGTYGTTVAPMYQFGRVDAFKMEAFGAGNPSSDSTPATTGETNVVGTYLDKVHNYKIGATTVQQRAIIKDVLDHTSAGFTSPQNATVGAWASFPSIVGLANTYVTNERGTLLTPSLQNANDTYLLMIAQSGGQCDRDNDASTGTSAGFAAINGGAVFNMAGGSRFGSFDNCKAFRENNFLKAIMLGGKGMVSLYSLDHHWYLHSLAMGQNIGYATKMSMNNHSTQLYTPVSWFGNVNYNAFMSPLGDPSIRASYFSIPSTFTASGTSGNPVNFSWSSVSGAEGYNIYKITSSSITKINTSMISGTTYSGSEIYASGTKYMVTALDLTTSGSGGTYYRESLGKIATTTGGGGGDVLAPSAPTNLMVTGTSANTVSLSWTASVGNPVGESVTYKVLRSSATNGTYTQTGSVTTNTVFTDSGLTAGNTYYYRVTASDAASNTSAPAPSATTGVAATPSDTQAPSAPAGLMSTTQTTSSITLTWSASTGNPVGETINYKVFRSATANGTYTQTGSSTTNTTFTDSTGLVAGMTYYYKVSATDAANNASAQTPSGGYGIATLANPTAPAAPVAAEESGATSVSFSANWSPSATATGYRLDVSTSNSFTTFVSGYNNLDVGNVTTYGVTDLSASSTYYYRVRAYNTVGTSASSGIITATTIAASGGGVGQVLGLMGVYAGPNNSEDVTPGANPAGAVDFYVDCVAGDDTRAGTSPATAWKTMDKFNSSGANQMVPGSRAFFKRGCRFYKTDVAPMPADQAGILSVSRSGSSSNYIEYKAYGTGTAPVISGAIPVTGWTQHAGSIYKANIGANKNVRFLFANDVDQTIARTPNRATDGSNVYMRTDSITGNTNATLTVSDSSSTDGSLPSSGTLNLTGGEYSARFLNWSYVVAPISAHSGQTITVSFPTGTNLPCYYPDCTNSVYPKAGWGYFVQNKLELLDTAGEWYYDNATGFVYFWAPGGVNPNSMTVEAAVHRNGVKLYGNIHHVKIKNLVFEKFNKFTYGGSDKGAAVFIQDWTGASGSINNIIENVEIKNTPIAVRVESDVSNASNGNKILNSYIHDIHDIGIISYGIGHLFQGNVIENVALDPAKFGDREEWNHAYAVVSTGGNSDTISNVIRNIGYIGVNYVANGEVRGNLVENVSLTINDGCGVCADGANNDLIVKRNVVNHAYGNVVGLPPTFIHNTPLGSGISTGDRNSIGGIFTENVVNDFGNSGMTFDNNMLSDNLTMSDNTIYTAQQGNERGARGISMYDQSVGVYHPGENNSVAGFDYTFNHKIHGNKVYTLHPKNISLSEVTIYGNNGTVADYGDYWGNYFFHPYTQSSIMLDRRSIQFKTGDYVWAKDATVPVFTTATGQTQVSGSPVAQHTKGYISGSESNYRWFVTFNGSAPDGWVDSWRMEQALRTPAEFDTIGGYPPAGQPGNTGPTYTTTNMPLLYVNTTGLPMNANIGSGKCGSNGQTLANPYPLNAFADAIVPENCSDQQ